MLKLGRFAFSDVNDIKFLYYSFDEDYGNYVIKVDDVYGETLVLKTCEYKEECNAVLKKMVQKVNNHKTGMFQKLWKRLQSIVDDPDTFSDDESSEDLTDFTSSEYETECYGCNQCGEMTEDVCHRCGEGVCYICAEEDDEYDDGRVLCRHCKEKCKYCDNVTTKECSKCGVRYCDECRLFHYDETGLCHDCHWDHNIKEDEKSICSQYEDGDI